MTTLKEALTQTKKLVIGSEETFKAIGSSKIKEVFVSTNYPSEKLSQLENLSNILSFKINKLKIGSEELGARCRRPHSVLIVGLLE